MRTGKKGSWTQLWKRNAVVAAIALFICAAVYLNWSYGQETEAGKTLGQSTLVGGQTGDPLVTGDSSAQTGAADQGDSAAQLTAGEAVRRSRPRAALSAPPRAYIVTFGALCEPLRQAGAAYGRAHALHSTELAAAALM